MNKIYITELPVIDGWNYKRNIGIDPSKLSTGSNRKVWWVCAKGHEWEAAPYNRIKGKSCPYCAGQKVCRDNCLATLNPELAAEWHLTKNGKLAPNDVTCSNNKKVWWTCRKGHSWKCIIYNRTRHGSGCPKCASLYYDNLILAKEWHPTKNGKLTPLDVYPNSCKKVWWQCEEGHEWEAFVYSRNGGNKGCPICPRGPVSKVSQKWLDELGLPVENREVWLEELSLRVDGFDPRTKTVYEFLGDYWHGNPKIYSPEEINQNNKKSFGKLFEETKAKISTLEKAGYKVCYIWEADFNKGNIEKNG